MTTPTASPGSQERWQRFAAASVRAFHVYAGWLAGMSWRRFAVLSVLLLVLAAILQDLPPFRWTYTETVSSTAKPRRALPLPPVPPAEPTAPKAPAVKIEKKGKIGGKGVDITIDENGVHVTPRAEAAPASAPLAEAAASGAAPAINIRVAPGSTADAIRQAVDEARRELQQAVEEARRDMEQSAEEKRDQAEAARELAQAQRELAQARREAADEDDGPQERTRVVHPGKHLPGFAMLWILASALVKITYKRQIQAEAQAQQAVETAEAESLKRQVVEARMAAMQAQVEPHFLFNTLASIDHLIEVDPQRASQMQKNLIALLRASMPTMREANHDGGGARDLGRELAVIRPYVEILKVRMEERLDASIDVPDGLASAEFPSMMLQTLVENAIKHGLEPKPEGGKLKVKAEIVHGKLAVSVADTGLGFGRAATAGTGVGLANIRERLQMLYGAKAALTIAENPGGGTLATITVPYKPVEGASA